jgi:hypothetical protein
MELSFDTRGNDAQKRCVEAWVDPTVSDIVYGGAKGGAKSFTGCKLIFGSGLIYPETYWFIARKKLNDLRKFTIPSIHECFSDWEINILDYAKYNGQDSFYQLHNGSRVYLLDVAYMPSDPLYTRFGSLQFTGGWGEETGEWEEAAANNLQAACGRWNNKKYGLPPKFLQTCNPSKNYLYRNYYRPFREGLLPAWKRFIQALPTDNKCLDPSYIENLKRVLNKNQKERLLYGNWEADDDAAALIEYDKILDTFTNTHVSQGKKYITADIARLGGDKIVIIEWDGWRGKVKHFTKQGLDVTGAKLEEIRYRLQIGNSEVLVDEDGMGGGIVDFLKFKGFVNNSSPLPAPNGPVDEKGNPIKENYDNLKSQCYFRMAERINRNELYLECDSEEVKQWIIEELEQVKQKALDSDLKKGVVPKDKVKELIGRSPDFSDAIMMREYFELKPKKMWAWA